MSVTIRQLAAFVAVAEARNFTRASETLRMAQPMVSGLVRDLETELGFRLFDRSTRRVEVTDAASELLEEARRLTHEFDGMVRRARDVASRRRGSVVVGAPPLLAAALLPPAMKSFARSSPQVSLTLVDRTVSQIYKSLLDGEIHLAVGTFLNQEDGIGRTPLMTYGFVLLCRADHSLARNRQPRWKDLAGEPLVTLRRGNGIREQLEAGYAAAGLRAEPAFELDQLTTIVGLVEAGFGITVLPSYAVRSFKRKALAARPLCEPKFMRRIDVAHRQDRSLSPAASEFVRLLRMNATKLSDSP